MMSEEECDFRRGYVFGMVNMVEAIFHEKAKKEEIEDYLEFMMKWRHDENRTGEPPSIIDFRNEMGSERRK